MCFMMTVPVMANANTKLWLPKLSTIHKQREENDHDDGKDTSLGRKLLLFFIDTDIGMNNVLLFSIHSLYSSLFLADRAFLAKYDNTINDVE